MASKQNTVDYILDQIADAGAVHVKKMFGEYAIYCNEKVVALVCDDQLYINLPMPVKHLSITMMKALLIQVQSPIY